MMYGKEILTVNLPINIMLARRQWLSVILTTQEAEIRRITARPGKYFKRPFLEKPFTKIRLVEWLKVKALSSSPSIAKLISK
jgi:hypothetical protein